MPATGKGERRKQSCLRARSLSSQKLPGVAGPTRRKVMGRKSRAGPVPRTRSQEGGRAEELLATRSGAWGGLLPSSPQAPMQE